MMINFIHGGHQNCKRLLNMVQNTIFIDLGVNKIVDTKNIADLERQIFTKPLWTATGRRISLLLPCSKTSVLKLSVKIYYLSFSFALF